MRALLVVLLLIVLGAGAAFLFLRQDPPDTETVQQPVVSPTLSVPEEKPPEPEPEPAKPEPEPDPRVYAETLPEQPQPEPLPNLSESDAEAAAAAASLIGEDAALRYLVSDAMIARLVATIDSLGSRQVPGNVMAVQSPESVFEATPDEWPDQIILNEAGDPVDQFKSSPANHQRYTAYVEMLEAIDTDDALAAYERYQPLFQEAYAQLGYGADSFEGRLVDVIDELLATPEVAEPVQLKKPEAFYLFVDEDLEALTAGQKMLVRMGPSNASRVKAKLREIRQALAQEP